MKLCLSANHYHAQVHGCPESSGHCNYRKQIQRDKYAADRVAESRPPNGRIECDDRADSFIVLIGTIFISHRHYSLARAITSITFITVFSQVRFYACSANSQQKLCHPTEPKE